jgi:Superinfection immunity protein
MTSVSVRLASTYSLAPTKGPIMTAAAAATASDSGSVVLGLFVWALIIAAYWIPTVIAFARHVPNEGSVAVINGFLGWTFIGWVVAMAMACRSVPNALASPAMYQQAYRPSTSGPPRDSLPVAERPPGGYSEPGGSRPVA